MLSFPRGYISVRIELVLLPRTYARNGPSRRLLGGNTRTLVEIFLNNPICVNLIFLVTFLYSFILNFSYYSIDQTMF